MPQEQMKVYCRRKNQTAPLVGIDALPDEVLQHVLSFLPLWEGVHTCVLARRWRHLWRSMPALRITWDTEYDFLSEEEVEHMNKFVDLLMFHRNHDAQLDFCEIHLKEFDWEGPEPHVNLWIRQALLSQVRSLIVEVDSINSGFFLLDTPIISKHLARLKLEFVELRDKFLDFSSCPALESLWICDCEIGSEKISSESLQHLTIIRSVFLQNTRTSISIPSLVSLQLTDNTTTPILESMPSLVKAFVRLHDSDDHCGKEEYSGSCSDEDNCVNCNDNSDRNRGCFLLKGLSQDESLELVAEPATVGGAAAFLRSASDFRLRLPPTRSASLPLSRP